MVYTRRQAGRSTEASKYKHGRTYSKQKPVEKSSVSRKKQDSFDEFVLGKELSPPTSSILSDELSSHGRISELNSLVSESSCNEDDQVEFLSLSRQTFHQKRKEASDVKILTVATKKMKIISNANQEFDAVKKDTPALKKFSAKKRSFRDISNRPLFESQSPCPLKTNSCLDISIGHKPSRLPVKSPRAGKSRFINVLQKSSGLFPTNDGSSKQNPEESGITSSQADSVESMEDSTEVASSEDYTYTFVEMTDDTKNTKHSSSGLTNITSIASSRISRKPSKQTDSSYTYTEVTASTERTVSPKERLRRGPIEEYDKLPPLLVEDDILLPKKQKDEYLLEMEVYSEKPAARRINSTLLEDDHAVAIQEMPTLENLSSIEDFSDKIFTDDGCDDTPQGLKGHDDSHLEITADLKIPKLTVSTNELDLNNNLQKFLESTPVGKDPERSNRLLSKKIAGGSGSGPGRASWDIEHQNTDGNFDGPEELYFSSTKITLPSSDVDDPRGQSMMQKSQMVQQFTPDIPRDVMRSKLSSARARKKQVLFSNIEFSLESNAKSPMQILEVDPGRSILKKQALEVPLFNKITSTPIMDDNDLEFQVELSSIHSDHSADELRPNVSRVVNSQEIATVDSTDDEEPLPAIQQPVALFKPYHDSMDPEQFVLPVARNQSLMNQQLTIPFCDTEYENNTPPGRICSDNQGETNADNKYKHDLCLDHDVCPKVFCFPERSESKNESGSDLEEDQMESSQHHIPLCICTQFSDNIPNLPGKLQVSAVSVEPFQGDRFVQFVKDIPDDILLMDI